MRTPETEVIPERLHIVGIGGSGLSAIARVLAARGHRVTGSDLRASALTEGLERLGVRVYVGHRAEQIGDAEWIVISSAIPETNPEVQAARAAGVPVVKRHRLLGALLGSYYGIAVAGTAGKTTTSAMIATVLHALGEDPSFIVGGVITGFGANARAGSGKHFVIEADEYDRTFFGLHPDVAVVTNVEMDHPDCFADLADVRSAFQTFLEGVAPGGTVLACAESPELGRVLEALQDGPRILTYGRPPEADYRLVDVRPGSRGGMAGDVVQSGRVLATLDLQAPGVHNLLNATAALAVADHLGLDPQAAAEALNAYAGVRRRFEEKGEAGGVLVVDDYAHHPTKVRATLAAARGRYPGRTLWVVFQPHTYSRTEALWDEFAAAFDDADHVVVTDIFAARSRERATVSAADLAAAIRHSDARYLGGREEIVEALVTMLRPGDVLLTLGAGDGDLIGEDVLRRLAGAQ